MKKSSLLKAGVIILLIITAGILYSCRGAGSSDTVITLKEQTLDQGTQDRESAVQTEETASAERESGGRTGLESKESDLAPVNQGLKETETERNLSGVSEDTHEYIYIHICGAVKNPDVYKVEADSRLVDVIKLAGGLTKAAAGDYVNQAAAVADGQQVYVPTKEEVKGTLPEGIISNGIGLNSAVGSKTPDSDAETGSNAGSGKVNINKASEEELMTLAGIGEAKAASIINYRQEHGGFKSIEEIKNINGIKDSVFNKISDRITVN